MFFLQLNERMFLYLKKKQLHTTLSQTRLCKCFWTKFNSVLKHLRHVISCNVMFENFVLLSVRLSQKSKYEQAC